MIFTYENHCLPVFCHNASGPGDFDVDTDGLTVTLITGADCSIQALEWSLLAQPGAIVVAAGALSLSLREGGHATCLGFQGSTPAQLAGTITTPLAIRPGACAGGAEMIHQLAAGHCANWEASSTAYTLLCRLAQALTTAEAKPLPALVSLTIAHIQEHYSEVYGVEELAGQLGVSKSHLVRSFSAALGITPGRYLTETRIHAAKKLLLQQAYPLDAVAVLCGFSGANYLCKVFKQETGLTPTNWRKQTTAQIPANDSSITTDDILYL